MHRVNRDFYVVARIAKNSDRGLAARKEDIAALRILDEALLRSLASAVTRVDEHNQSLVAFSGVHGQHTGIVL